MSAALLVFQVITQNANADTCLCFATTGIVPLKSTKDEV